MAVRVADSLKQQNDLKTFPVAYSEDIWLDENKGEGDANFKDLQTLYNENKLGGSGLPEPESADKVLVSASSNTRADGLEWKQVSKNDVGLQLPEFESLEEWDSLPAEEKSKYYNAGKGYVVIKEDVKGAKGVIDDTKPNSTVTTLSAKKINDSLVDLEPLHKRIANPTPKDLNAILEEGTYSIGSLFEYENAPKDVSSFGNLIVTVGKTYITQEWLSGNDVSGSAWRTYRDNTSWSDWRYVATMDKVVGFPDYSNATMIMNSTRIHNTWTATADGFIMVSLQAVSDEAYLRINNISLANLDYDGHDHYSFAGITGCYPVKKGDVVFAHGAGGVDRNYVKFCPFR